MNQEGISFENQPRAINEKDLPSLTERAKIIKDQGAKAILQLHHGGIDSDKDYSGIDPVIIDKLTNEEIMEQVGIYVNNYILDILIIEKINGEALMEKE